MKGVFLPGGQDGNNAVEHKLPHLMGNARQKKDWFFSVNQHKACHAFARFQDLSPGGQPGHLLHGGAGLKDGAFLDLGKDLRVKGLGPVQGL